MSSDFSSLMAALLATLIKAVVLDPAGRVGLSDFAYASFVTPCVRMSYELASGFSS